VNKRTLKFGLATAVIALEAALLAGPALAQVDEIRVTARKREESLQDVPLSVTAFDQTAITRTYSNTLDELEKFIPNVELSNIEFSGQTLGASIRGVSFADLEKTFEPAVGVSIDGVFLGSNTGGAIDVFDIEQVEVLRGPQGTLYGRNTIGGVINVRRTRPTEEMELRALSRIGRNNQREFLVVANSGKIGGVLSTKGYFFSDYGETYATNVATGERDKQEDSIRYGAAFLYEPTDNFNALLSFDIFNDDSFGAPVYNLTLPVNDPNDPAQNFFISGTGNFCDLTIDAASIGLLPPDQAQNGCFAASRQVASDTDFREYVRDFPFRNFIDGWNATAELNWDIGDFTVTSVFGYRDSDEQLYEENIGAPNVNGLLTGGVSTPIFVANRIQEYEQISEELRIAGDLTENLTVVAGGYFLRTDYSIRGDNGPFGAAFGPLSVGQAFVLGAPVTNFTAAQETTVLAGFFDGTWQITDRFSFSGGARVTWDEKEFDLAFLPCAGCVLPADPALQSTSLTEDWLRPTGRGIFQYEFTPDIMGFAGWSRGFRSGGFNGRATTVTAAGPYDPETVDSFEGGFRTEWLDNRLRFNPSFFYALYKDKQEEIIRAAADGSGNTETIVENASEVTIWGVEFEAAAQPTDKLTLRAVGGYLNADFDSFIVDDIDLVTPSSPRFDPTADPNNLPQIDVADTRALRRAPEFSFSVGGNYVQPIFDGRMQVTLTADYSWSDEFATSPVIDTVPGQRRHIIPDDGSADFAVTIETLNEKGGNLSLTGFVNDAFHDGVGRQSNSLDAGVFYFAAGQPTTVYGLEAIITFN